MREEHLTGLVRGLGTGLIQLGVTTLSVYQVMQEWEGALVGGTIAGLLALSAFFGLGVYDARRNDARGGNGGNGGNGRNGGGER